jgi:hypothetical protein
MLPGLTQPDPPAHATIKAGMDMHEQQKIATKIQHV